MKRLLLVAIMLLMAGCGGSGGGDTATIVTTPPSVTPAVKKTSIVDGTWRIVMDGTWRDPLHTPQPPAGYDPLYLGIFDYITFDNGTISGVTSTGITITKSGSFTVNNGILDYTFTSFDGFQPVYATNPITGKSELIYNETKRSINEHISTNVTVTGNSMSWKDNYGNIIANFVTPSTTIVPTTPTIPTITATNPITITSSTSSIEQLSTNGQVVKNSHPTWQNNFCNAIAVHRILIGMSKEQVILSVGNYASMYTYPNSTLYEQWVMPTGTLPGYIYFDATGLVTWWSDPYVLPKTLAKTVALPVAEVWQKDLEAITATSR